MPVDYAAAAPTDKKEFEDAFYNLLKLQATYVLDPLLVSQHLTSSNRGERLRDSSAQPRSEKDGLYPIQALVQPVSLRFKYHFESTRQTNRLDKVSDNSKLYGHHTDCHLTVNRSQSGISHTC